MAEHGRRRYKGRLFRAIEGILQLWGNRELATLLTGYSEFAEKSSHGSEIG